ncbi:MAG: FHA domain-containing protein [Clostridia bacterium]|nr:FHA domain-containing protein [Clostridia bacterium]
MDDIIKLGCPVCGTVLSVRNQNGIESKSVTCPVCKTKSPFRSFKRISNGYGDEPTEYPQEGNDPNADQTAINDGVNYILGRISVPAVSLSFQLRLGKNVIGRKGEASSAGCQIPCTNKRMSREHLVIEVKKVPGKGFVHYASLFKEKVNATYVNNHLLEYGDKIVLKNHDVIKLPDVVVHFEIPDRDETDF